MSANKDVEGIIRSLHELAGYPESWMVGPGIPPESATVKSASEWIRRLFNEGYDVEVFPSQNNAVLLSAMHGKYSLDFTISDSHVKSLEIQRDTERGYDIVALIEAPTLKQIYNALRRYGPDSGRSRILPVFPSRSILEEYKKTCIFVSSPLDIIASKSRVTKSPAFQIIRDRYPSSIWIVSAQSGNRSASTLEPAIRQYAETRSQSDLWSYAMKMSNGADRISKKMYA